MYRSTVTCATLIVLIPALVGAESVPEAAREIFDRSGVTGGLIVHVGEAPLHVCRGFTAGILQVCPADAFLKAHIQLERGLRIGGQGRVAHKGGPDHCNR